MTASERERIRLEVLEAIGESHRMSMMRVGSPYKPILELILRERAAALGKAAGDLEFQAGEAESDGNQWLAAARRDMAAHLRALAAQERAR